MRITKRLLIFFPVLAVTLNVSGEVGLNNVPPGTHDFINRYCVECHGPDKQKGKLRLDTLAWDMEDEKTLEVWQEIIDQVNMEEMPAEKARQQPSAVENRAFIDSISASFAAGRYKAGKQSVVLRRLNKSQYRNTVSDLLKIDSVQNDLAGSFPSDDLVDGFDNNGESLVMSDFLMRQYLKAAHAAVDLAVYENVEPSPATYRMFQNALSETSKGGNDKKEKKRSKKGAIKGKADTHFDTKAMPPGAKEYHLYMNDEKFPGKVAGQVLYSSSYGASRKGWYEFEFEVESRGRDNPMDLPNQKLTKYHRYNPDDLHRLEIYLIAPLYVSSRGTERRLFESIDLPDNKRITLKRRIWMDKNWRVGLAFGNATFTSTAGYAVQIGATAGNNEEKGVWKDKIKEAESISIEAGRKVAEEYKKWYKANKADQPELIYSQLVKIDGPRIVIHSASETGPIYNSWPPASHQAFFGEKGKSNEEVIRAFAKRAFRRPVSGEELAPYIRLGMGGPEELRKAIEAILCSPQFIYLYEPEGELDSYAIASRLSYFLWDTMPDDELMALAERSALKDPAVLRAQTLRLLRDPRSNRFVKQFVWGWLKLKNTVDMPPDPTKFYEYYRGRYHFAMVKETELFFRHLLDENSSISDFIDADYAFINADLGRHYGIKGVNTTARFVKVALKPEDHRGGLLGQASVLTASADGVATSPVTRGIWILDNLLGTPPPPPPPGLNTELAPDTRGAKTIRERLAAHRVQNECNQCHKKIDPMGFALESFDPIGSWRVNYTVSNQEGGKRGAVTQGPSVETSGHMPNGKAFSGVNDMKKIVLSDLTLFRRNLISKLLTFGTGREMKVLDRAELDRVAEKVKAKEDGFQDLILEVVTSQIFLRK